MNQDLIELYSDYLLSSFNKTTATGLSELLDNQYSCSDLKTETPGPENRGHFETTLGENISGSRPTLNDNGPTLTEKSPKTAVRTHNK